MAEKRKLILINKAALDELVSLQDAIAIVDAAMRDYSAGQVGSPQRTVLNVNPATRMGVMPGTMPGLGRFGVKIVSLSSDAPKFGLYSHQGMMILFDDATGQPLCMVECHALTRLRTAAASAVATRALSRPDSKILTIIGNGDLAEPHIDAISAVRPIEQVIVWGRQRGKVEEFVQSLPAVLNQNITVTSDIRQAVGLADIICTVTSSSEPLIHGEWLKPGQHLNLVGSSVRGPREVDDDVVARGYYIADSRPHALSQGAELCHAIEQGKVKEDHLKGEIGEVLAGSVPGRTNREQITIYKSLGHTAQDISVANAALSRAAESGKVVAIDW
jgi:ornithine cyclodeaminase/alanine dehydrogenase-like protein (mu-crystallin family)